MSIGNRMSHLHSAHAESRREPALLIGDTYSSITPVKRVEITSPLHPTIKMIALGYGIKVELLLTGRDAGQEFRSHLSRLSRHSRWQLFFFFPADRVKMVIQFLMAEFANQLSVERLAPALGMAEDQIEMLLVNRTMLRLTDKQILRAGESLSRITGIPSQWFHSGSLGDGQAEPMPTTNQTCIL